MRKAFVAVILFLDLLFFLGMATIAVHKLLTITIVVAHSLALAFLLFGTAEKAPGDEG